MALLYVLSLLASVASYLLTWKLRRRLRYAIAVLIFVLLALLPTVIWLAVGDPPPGATTYTPAEVGNP